MPCSLNSLRVRRSARLRSIIARARPLRTVAPAWQQKSARNGCAKAGAHFSRKQIVVRTRVHRDLRTRNRIFFRRLRTTRLRRTRSQQCLKILFARSPSRAARLETGVQRSRSRSRSPTRNLLTRLRIRRLGHPADFSACAPDCTHTGYSRHAFFAESHGRSSCPSRCRCKRPLTTQACAPPTVAHASRIRGADLAVANARPANFAKRARERLGYASCAGTRRRNTRTPAVRGDSAVHFSIALAICVTCGRLGCFRFHGCDGCSLKHETVQVVQP